MPSGAATADREAKQKTYAVLSIFIRVGRGWTRKVEIAAFKLNVYVTQERANFNLNVPFFRLGGATPKRVADLVVCVSMMWLVLQKLQELQLFIVSSRETPGGETIMS